MRTCFAPRSALAGPLAAATLAVLAAGCDGPPVVAPGPTQPAVEQLASFDVSQLGPPAGGGASLAVSATPAAVPAAGGGDRDLSAGPLHTCGLRPDGAAVCWGWNQYGQAAPPAGPFVQVSAGFGHSCARVRAPARRGESALKFGAFLWVLLQLDATNPGLIDRVMPRPLEHPVPWGPTGSGWAWRAPSVARVATGRRRAAPVGTAWSRVICPRGERAGVPPGRRAPDRAGGAVR